ncbi:hypothetical protein CERZMDRAFT_92852 [Cercospora zeae-maydis SCOH1-5]|uniref:Uncharacterized protein n=1 Tax=Cercospora zeae-maydis SCOH1-5 TaxID=717836 RepID=A0A6A6FTS9_9PEZI|nr:hypothetical protein CERZMDRAFT_92852 [Cercospora zeae-maydis SCOH1-5]
MSIPSSPALSPASPPITRLPLELCEIIIDSLPLRKDQVNAKMAFNMTVASHRVLCRQIDFTKIAQSLSQTILGSAHLSRRLADEIGVKLQSKEQRMKPSPASAFTILSEHSYAQLAGRVNSNDSRWWIQGQPYSAALLFSEKNVDILRLRAWILFGVPYLAQRETPKQRKSRISAYKRFVSKIASDPDYCGDACQECLLPIDINVQQALGTKFCWQHRAVFCEHYRVNIRDFEHAFVVLQGRMAPSSPVHFWMEPSLAHMSPTSHVMETTVSPADANTISLCLTDMTWQNFRIHARNGYWTPAKARSLETRYWICGWAISTLQGWVSQTTNLRPTWNPGAITGCLTQLDFHVRKMLVDAPKSREHYTMLHKFMQQLYIRHISKFPEVGGRFPAEAQEYSLMDAMAGDYLSDQLLKYSRISDLRLLRDFDIKVCRPYEPLAFRSTNRPTAPAIICEPQMSIKLDAFTCTIEEAERLAMIIHGCKLHQIPRLPEHLRRLNLGRYVTKIAVMEHVRSSVTMDTLEIYFSLWALFNSTVCTGKTPLPAIPGSTYSPDVFNVPAVELLLQTVEAALLAQKSPELLSTLSDITDLDLVAPKLIHAFSVNVLMRGALILRGITEESFKEWKKDKAVYIIADPMPRAMRAMDPLQQRTGPYKCVLPTFAPIPWADRHWLFAGTGFFAGRDAHIPLPMQIACRGRKVLQPPNKQSEALFAEMTKHTWWVHDGTAAAFISKMSLQNGGLQPKVCGRVVWFDLKEALA